MILYFPGATSLIANLTTSRKSPNFFTRNRNFDGGMLATLAISSMPRRRWFPTATTKTSTPAAFNFLAFGTVHLGLTLDWPSVSRSATFLDWEPRLPAK